MGFDLSLWRNLCISYSYRMDLPCNERTFSAKSRRKYSVIDAERWIYDCMSFAFFLETSLRRDSTCSSALTFMSGIYVRFLFISVRPSRFLCFHSTAIWRPLLPIRKIELRKLLLTLYMQLPTVFQKLTRYMADKGLPVFDNPLPSKDHAYKKSLFASNPFS